MSASQSSGAGQTRRQFLVNSTVLAGASLAGTIEISRSAYAAGTDLIKIGLVGCGGRGSGAAANALSVAPNARLTAMADAFADRMENSRKVLKQKLGPQVNL